jgi:hypothetical protein
MGKFWQLLAAPRNDLPRLQRDSVGIRKPLFYPLNYGDLEIEKEYNDLQYNNA